MMNACASNDWIVALFPAFYDWTRRNIGVLAGWRRLHIGDAGFSGFDRRNRYEITFLKGGHGAFVDLPPAISAAVDFVLMEDVAPEDAGDTIGAKTTNWITPRENGFLRFANNFVPLAWGSIATLIGLGIYFGGGFLKGLMDDPANMWIGSPYFAVGLVTLIVGRFVLESF